MSNHAKDHRRRGDKPLPVKVFRTNKTTSSAGDAGDVVSVPIEQECCMAEGWSFVNPGHKHVCTIVLVDDPEVDDHESHACYCGEWWHDR